MKKIKHFLFFELCEWLGLDPFSDVINCYHDVLELIFRSRKGSDNIYPLLEERALCENMSNLWLRLMAHPCMSTGLHYLT